MRLARLVAAGLVLGAVAGFVAALVRPRGNHLVPQPQQVSVQVPQTPQTSPDTRPLLLPNSPALSGTGGLC